MHILYVVALSLGWTVEQGDVEAAFLNGLKLSRRLILRAPKQGLPEIPGMMQRIQPGEYLLALKGVYGVNDAPNLWSGRHAQGLMDTGAVQSALAPRTLFLWFDKKHPANEHVTLTGIAGTHVDDDLFAGTDWWKAHVLPVVRRTFSYGKWANGHEPYIHLGRRVTQTPQKVILDQEQYALGLRQIEVKKIGRAHV